MQAITRNITDLAADERTVLEGLVGSRLSENQRVVVQVMDAGEPGCPGPPRTIDDYAILAELDAETLERFDEALQRSPSRDQPTL